MKLRIILPRTVGTEEFRSARKTIGSRIEVGLLEEVKLVLAINERSAGFGLPTLDGRPDYSRGFIGNDPTFQGWCRDLFSYY
jgi:predicted transcriptional regulator